MKHKKSLSFIDKIHNKNHLTYTYCLLADKFDMFIEK